MTILSVVEQAIRTRTPIQLQYVREGKTTGVRTGNPHIVFIRRLKSGDEHVYLLLWQTGGVTDSGQELPSWRQFFLNDIVAPTILSGEGPFHPADSYNPASYEHPIAKV